MSFRLLIGVAALLLLAPSATMADQRVPVHQPTNAATDPSLVVFRGTLAVIAGAHDLKALDQVVGKTFFWERDFGGGYDAKATPMKNLTEALLLDDAKLEKEYQGTGWRRLAEIAASPMFVPGEHGGDEEGAVKTKAGCGPAAPTYKEAAIDDILTWAYVLDQTELRAEPSANANSVATLENEAVEVVEPASAEVGHADFAKVKLPDGKTGYLAAGDLHSFLDDQLCFAKHGGNWRIVGYIGGGD